MKIYNMSSCIGRFYLKKFNKAKGQRNTLPTLGEVIKDYKISDLRNYNSYYTKLNSYISISNDNYFAHVSDDYKTWIDYGIIRGRRHGVYYGAIVKCLNRKNDKISYEYIVLHKEKILIIK